MADKTLWDEFNLALNNPDKGAGILYCLRYDHGRIKAHQLSVIDALKSSGFELEDLDKEIAVKLTRSITDSEKFCSYALLEELSCLNEALEYCDAGFNQFNDIDQLKNGLIGSYFDLIKKNNLSDAYNLVTMLVPQIIGELRIAGNQNKVLSKSDRRDLADLANFAQAQEKFLNNSEGFVLFGLK